jgi:hypothetical protein
MLTSEECFAKFGEPKDKSPYLKLWNVPANLLVGKIPKKIYCNSCFIEPLTKAFENLIQRNKVDELKTFNGCFNIRPIRGYENSTPVKYSLHSWGVAVDFNLLENGLGAKPKLSDEFVLCFEDAGFDWGGHFKRVDGMHFQLKELP